MRDDPKALPEFGAELATEEACRQIIVLSRRRESASDWQGWAPPDDYSNGVV